MKLSSLALAALLSALATGILHAQGTLGAGGTLCSQYVKAARSSDITYHQASNWLLGYVSGIDEVLRASGQPSPLANLTGDQVLRTVAAYCEANPTSTVANAANLWHAAAKPAAANTTAPQQADAKKDDGDWVKLNLTAPARKPLLDRR